MLRELFSPFPAEPQYKPCSCWQTGPHLSRLVTCCRSLKHHKFSWAVTGTSLISWHRPQTAERCSEPRATWTVIDFKTFHCNQRGAQNPHQPHQTKSSISLHTRVLANLGHWQGQAWWKAIFWNPQKYLHGEKNPPVSRALFSWLLPPLQRLRRLVEPQVPYARKHRPSPDKHLNDTPWIQLWPGGQHTAHDISEHYDSFCVFHVRLTLVLMKP